MPYCPLMDGLCPFGLRSIPLWQKSNLICHPLICWKPPLPSLVLLVEEAMVLFKATSMDTTGCPCNSLVLMGPRTLSSSGQHHSSSTEIYGWHTLRWLKLAKKPSLYCIRFGHILGRPHCPMPNCTPDSITTTKLPKSVDEVCQFRFSVYWSPNHGCWFSLSKQQGCLSHSDVPRLLVRFLLLPGLQNKKWKITAELELDTPVLNVLCLHHACTGILLQLNQIDHLWQYNRKLLIECDQSTPASTLYNYLTRSPLMFHCVLTAERDAAS